MYTPASKELVRRGRSLNSRDRRIDSLKNNDSTGIYDVSQNHHDLISKKYRETYGTSIVSKSKDKPKRRSLKKDEFNLNSSYDKDSGSKGKDKTQFNFNKTIEYNSAGQNGSKNKKPYKIGADLGFDSVNKTIDYTGGSNSNRPYIRRIIYH